MNQNEKNSSQTLLVLWHGALFPSYRKPFWLLQEQYGWNVHLISVRSWSQALPTRTVFQPSDHEPIQVHLLSSLFKFHGALYVQPGLPFLFQRIKPDLVYVIEEPFSVMGWLTAYWCKRHVPPIPIVVFSYQDILKRYPIPFRWMERFTLRHAERLLVSNSQAGSVIAQKGYDRLWDVLPSPVDLDRFCYREPVHQEGLFTIGYVGRLVDEKGLDTVLWALSELEDTIRFRIVGDGNARFRLEKLAKELGVYERVGFVGPIHHEALPSFYHECNAVVLPSKTQSNWQEQFGRVLVESMACGTPVIGSDCGAIPEVIGDAGLIFPEGNATALADRIQALSEDRRLQRALSLQGRVRAEHLYSAERIAARLHQHFREVLDHARGA